MRRLTRSGAKRRGQVLSIPEDIELECWVRQCNAVSRLNEYDALEPELRELVRVHGTPLAALQFLRKGRIK